MDDLISRDALKKRIENLYRLDWDEIKKCAFFAEVIDGLSSADPERTVQVENVKAGGLYGVHNGNCGWCKSYVEDNYNFCPYCGTRLDWGE